MDRVKKYLGEILMVIGTFLSTYNLFNFSYKTSRGLIRLSEGSKISGVAYYYSQNTIVLISVGLTLVVVGILIIKNKELLRKN